MNARAPETQSQPSRQTQEVRDLIARSERSQVEIASYLNRRLNTDSYRHYDVSRMVTGKTKKIPSEVMDALRELAAQPATETPAAPNLTETDEAVPLFGYANAAGSVLRLNEDQRVGVVPIHPAQRGSKRAFAFIVFGDSISPMLSHGDIGYALRGYAPKKGKPVLIEKKDGDTLVKIYEGQDEHTLFARQLKPAKDLTFPLGDVRAIHAVVGSSFGPV